MVKRILIAYWPWWIAIAWLLIYETIALCAGAPTLSRMVWNGRARWKWLGLVVGLVMVLLWGHFFLDWWRYDPAP